MTDRVNPSYRGGGSSYETAGAIALGGGSDGYVQPSGSPTDMAVQASGIDDTALAAFDETSSGSSLTVTIDAGEAFVNGAWLARDVSTNVTLAASTNNQTIYAGYDATGQDVVIIGLSGAFNSDDRKIELFEFDTDGTGVTSVTDLRRTDRVADSIPATIDSERNLQPEGAQSGLAADSTGIKYEGDMRQLLDPRLFDDPRAIYIEAATNSSASDETVTVEVYDDTAGAVVATLDITGGSPRARSPDVKSSLASGNEVHVRWNVTSASATGGATFDAINARLVIE